jgi:DNA mismatch repair ATPase MutS
LTSFASCGFTLEENIFVTLKNEILFYLSFLEFEQQLQKNGYRLSVPQLADCGMEIKGVYDIALAWKKRFVDYQVVPNDIRYEKEKSFMVITGPNQGGKTTLARAVGQCIYFMKIGLKAPCQSMSSIFFQDIMTHFEVEESVETGAGKLKEELQRLKPMMQNFHKKGTAHFVILNELFTTATTYDACIMAQKVMKFFIEDECMGIYVTHIQELADETTQKGIQSMVAQVDPQNPSHRTFQILPMKAAGLGYSDSIVRKYELDFEHMTKRLSDI